MTLTYTPQPNRPTLFKLNGKMRTVNFVISTVQLRGRVDMKTSLFSYQRLFPSPFYSVVQYSQGPNTITSVTSEEKTK
jgi:hypothetical protein